MATYTREGKFTPVNIDSNQIPALQQKMTLMAKGEALIRSQYQNALDLDLTHGENQAKLNTFFKDAQEKVNKVISKGNLDNYANVDAALQIFDPLASEEYRSVMMDNSYTKHYKEQIAVAERYRNQKEKDGSVGSGYSDFNYKDLVNHYSQFKTGTPNDYSSWGSKYSYRPYYDDAAERRELAKEFLKLPDSFTRESANEYGVVTSTTYEGKSASQLQKYISNNLSAKAKDQALLEGRVLVYDMKDGDYLKFLTEHTEKQLKEVDDDLVRLQVLKKDKNNKSFTEAEFKKQFDYLSDTRKELAENLQKLSDPDYQKSEIKKKAETFANYYLNKKIANTASAMANDRVSMKLETNSAIVSALNRQQNLNTFLTKYRQDQVQFQAMMQHRTNMLNTQINIANQEARLRERLALINATATIEAAKIREGTSKTNKGKENEDERTGLFGTILNTPIKDEKEIVKIREQMKAEIEGSMEEVLTTTLPYSIDAFGINSSENKKNFISAVAGITNLSQRLQNGDKELTKLLQSTPQDEKSFSKKQIATKRILEVLDKYDLQRLTYHSYQKASKVAESSAKQVLLNTFKQQDEETQARILESRSPISTKVPLSTPWSNGFNLNGNSALPDLSAAAARLESQQGPVPPRFKNLEEAADFFTKHPEEANAYFGLKISLAGKKMDFSNFIQTNVSNVKDAALIQAYYINHKNLYIAKPVDNETPESKAATSAFNKEVAGFTPYLQQQGLYAEDYAPENVVGFTRQNGGVEILYRPTALVSSKLGLSKVEPKSLFLPVPELGTTYNDQRDKIFLNILALSPTGETGGIKARGPVPITYKIATKSGAPFSAGGQGGYKGSIQVDGKYYDIPYDDFNKPTDIEAFVTTLSQQAELSVFQTINFELAKENKAPLTQTQRTEMVRSGEFKRRYNAKLKEVLHDDYLVFSMLGLNNPNYTSTELMFLNQDQQ